jgi:hypothetical protein
MQKHLQILRNGKTLNHLLDKIIKTLRFNLENKIDSLEKMHRGKNLKL